MIFQTQAGDYRKMGTEQCADGVTFTFQCPKELACAVVLFEKKTGKQAAKIDVLPQYRVGSVRSVTIYPLKAEKFYYCYEIAGKRMRDPYGERVIGREKWGDTERTLDDALLSGFKKEGFDWSEDVSVEIPANEMVMYKLHVRGFSMDGRGRNKGTFAAVMDRLSYLKELGITTLECMPVYEFEELMENGRLNYWGYAPSDYFAVKSSYASQKDADWEFKSLILETHKQQMELIMEMHFVPEQTAGAIIEILRYWVMEYHVDGFRFDLMGLHDTETMNEIRAALDCLPGGKEILMYGEPWTAGKAAIQPGYEQALKCNAALLSDRIGFFNDDIRDSIKGSVFEVKETGFVNGAKGLETQIRSSVLGFCDGMGGYQPSSAHQSVSYVSAHDNYTLWDKLVHTLTDSMEPDFGAYNEVALAQNRLAAGIYFTCLGITFLQAGEEAARTKYGDDNSYRSAAKVNQLDWTRMHEYRDLAEFYRGLILLRKSFPAWRQRSLEVLDQISFVDAPEGCVAFIIRTGAEPEAAAESVLTDNVAPWQELFIIYNANKEAVEFRLPGGKGSDPEQEPSENYFALEGKWQLLTDGTRFKIKEDTKLEQIKELEGSVWAEPVSITILGR